MAYTIDYAYLKVLDSIDKDGSDFFNIPRVLKAFESATYDLIEEEYQTLNLTQRNTDVLKPLIKTFSISAGITTTNFDNYSCSVVAIPGDYLHLIEVSVNSTLSNLTYSSRMIKLISAGKLDLALKNPNMKPTVEYPLLVLLTNTFNVYITKLGVVTLIKGFYLKKPDFGAWTTNIDGTNIIVDLEDFVVEKIIKKTANDLLLTIGDPRAEGKYRQEKEFGKV